MNDSLKKYCPKCGLFSHDNKPICEFCKIPVLDSDMPVAQFKVMTSYEKEKWRVGFENNVIKPNPEYDPNIAELNYKWRLEQLKRDIASRSDAPHCPKCGSPDFQMVQRKWSLLSGFFTNKVDRVCTRCKSRF